MLVFPVHPLRVCWGRESLSASLVLLGGPIVHVQSSYTFSAVSTDYVFFGSIFPVTQYVLRSYLLPE